MAIDQCNLWRASFPSLSDQALELRGLPFLEQLRLGGRLLFESYGERSWTSGQDETDTVRAWRAFAVGAAPGLPLRDRLSVVHGFATDEHFAVREWAWLSVRPHVCDEPFLALDLLRPTGRWKNPRWRRFVSEVTRPRSVWGRHIPELKATPERAEVLVGRLLTDENRAVVVAATNWLNDVCTTHHAWVVKLCQQAPRLQRPDTDWLLRRATRRVTRAAHPASVL
jgi:3-methyladenine DNA glycosylase AlkC